MKKNIYMKPSIEMIEFQTEGVIATSGLGNNINNPNFQHTSNSSSSVTSGSTIGSISKEDVHPWSGKYSK